MNAFGHNDSEARSAKIVIQDVQSLSRLLSRSIRKKQGNLSLSNTMTQIITCLREDGPQSVPRIARKLGVGRQHIQRTVNELMGRDMAVRLANPDHQRSWLIDLTAHGQFILESRNEDEIALAETLLQTLGADDLKTCHKVLAQLKQCLTPGTQTPARSPKAVLEHGTKKSATVISWGRQSSGLNI